MAQLIVRNLEEPVVEGLRRRARRNKRSTEAEVREILRAAVGAAEPAPRRLGSELASLFAGSGLPGEIEELRGHVARPARLRG